jgi:hypothetical protein
MTVHLAGALGCSVWMPLHYLPDWRWKLEGATSAWYPSLRLFRQERRDWGHVIERMTTALAAASAARKDA